MSKRVWITTAIVFLLQPLLAHAESAAFLQPYVSGFESSVVCLQGEEDCQTVFLIEGKNFLNTNGNPGVKVGSEWAEVVRANETLLVAIASSLAQGKSPVVSLDTTLHRPTFESPDATLTSIFEDSVDVALASIGVTEDGTRYIAAGSKYMDPPRVYYRDSYWASGLVLMIEPYVVRDQILLLARGIEKNGRVPSAIPVDPEGKRIPLWEDHFDSGAYFIMMVYDYVRWTGDETILDEKVGGRTVFAAMEDIVSYLSTKDTDGNLLPEKPENSLQDWLDSIPRSGEIISNVSLYYRSLRNLVELATLVDEPSHALSFHRQSLLIRYQINTQFWNKKSRYLYESCFKGACVERVTAESALAVLYDVLLPEYREAQLEALDRLKKDWGVLNAWPLYNGHTRYHYQNGTDWPFLDGIMAGARLKAGDDGWYFPLTRWWTYNEELGRGMVLPEYVTYLNDAAGDEQAWSVNPIVSYIRYGLEIDPPLGGTYAVASVARGNTTLGDVVVRGRRVTVRVNGPE